MKTLKLIFAIFIYVISFQTNANDNDEFAIRFKEALQIVVNGHGDLTKAEYENFWKLVPHKNIENKNQLINYFKENYLDFALYSKTVWGCANEAWLTKKVPACDKATEYANNISNSQKNSKKDVMEIPREHTRLLLQAASKHTEFFTTEGKKIDLDLELIKRTNESLDNTFTRLSQAFK